MAAKKRRSRKKNAPPPKRQGGKGYEHRHMSAEDREVRDRRPARRRRTP